MIPAKFLNANSSTITVTNVSTSLKDLIDTAGGGFNNFITQVDGFDICPETADIRIAYGNNPTATQGFILKSNTVYSFRFVDFANIRLIRTGGSNVTCSLFVGQSLLGELTISSMVGSINSITGDVTISGYLSVGQYVFTQTVYLTSRFVFGGSFSNPMIANKLQTGGSADGTFMLAGGSTHKTFAFVGNAALLDDYSIPLESTNPKSYFFSGTRASVAKDEWGAFQRNADDFIIDVGAGGEGNLFLKPDSAGYVKFGTVSALAGEALSGYITIKDAGGNLRKLAIIA